MLDVVIIHINQIWCMHAPSIRANRHMWIIQLHHEIRGMEIKEVLEGKILRLY